MPEPLASPDARPFETIDGTRGSVSTRGRMLGATARIHGPEAAKTGPLLRETVGEWIHAAQERIRKTDSAGATKRAMESLRHLPDTIRPQWESNLTRLAALAERPAPDTTTGDPIAILRFINNIQPDLAALRKLSASTGNTDTLRAVRNVHDAIDAYQRAIGQGHPAVNFINPQAFMQDSRIAKRGGDITRTSVFIVGTGAFMVTGLLAFFAKPEDRNVKLPGMYLVIAALAAGWGDITMKGNERLGRQIGFLTEPGGAWERLQNDYRLHGPEWADYTRNYYRSGREDPLVASAFGAKRPVAKAERDAILGLAPAGIQRTVESMLNTHRDGSHAADWKLMTGFLNGATSDDARSIVLEYVGSGATRASLAALNRGAR